MVCDTIRKVPVIEKEEYRRDNSSIVREKWVYTVLFMFWDQDSTSSTSRIGPRLGSIRGHELFQHDQDENGFTQRKVFFEVLFKLQYRCRRYEESLGTPGVTEEDT